MSPRLRLLAPDTVDLAELGALLARLRRTAPGVEVGTDPVVGAVTVRLTLGAADAPPAGPDGTRPLGPHPLLVDAVAARVAAALGGSGAGPEQDGTAVLLVAAAGSPQGNAETAKVARLLQEGRSFAFVEHAFLARARPGIDEGVRRCLALGANRVVVAPYALLDPPFLAGVRAQVGPAVGVVVAEELGDSPQLAELVLSRYREVLDGDSRCSCAACAYRPTAVGHE